MISETKAKALYKIEVSHALNLWAQCDDLKINVTHFADYSKWSAEDLVYIINRNGQNFMNEICGYDHRAFNPAKFKYILCYYLQRHDNKIKNEIVRLHKLFIKDVDHRTIKQVDFEGLMEVIKDSLKSIK